MIFLIRWASEEYLGCLKMLTKDVTGKFLPAVKHEYLIVHLVGED